MYIFVDRHPATVNRRPQSAGLSAVEAVQYPPRGDAGCQVKCGCSCGCGCRRRTRRALRHPLRPPRPRALRTNTKASTRATGTGNKLPPACMHHAPSPGRAHPNVLVKHDQRHWPSITERVTERRGIEQFASIQRLCKPSADCVARRPSYKFPSSSKPKPFIYTSTRPSLKRNIQQILPNAIAIHSIHHRRSQLDCFHGAIHHRVRCGRENLI